MQVDLLSLANSARGHYQFESGYHGDTWLDLEGLFVRPSAMVDNIRDLSKRLSAHKIDAVCGPVTGGAFAAEACPWRRPSRSITPSGSPRFARCAKPARP